MAFINTQAQVVTIPDSIFKTYLIADTTINSNQDSLIQLSEAQSVTHLNISNKAIQNLTGIKSFSSLANLNCSNNLLSSLDLSGNVELDTLICNTNSLSSICVNSKQFQNITEYSSSWVKDPGCEWNRVNCSIENDNCFALFYTTFDSTKSTFYGWVDSLSTADAVSWRWDFGDGTSANFPAPAVYYNKDETYTVCMKITTASGDSCEYCHTLGFDTSGVILKHGGLGDGFIFKVMQFGDTIVGVNQQIATPSSYSIGPNPTKDVVNVVFNHTVKNTSIRLINTTGQTLLEQKNRTGSRFEFDVENLARGMYILEVYQNESVSFKKIIKQ